MTDLVERLDSYLTELVTEEAGAAPLIDETIEEIERLQARSELLEKVVKAASACIVAWDNAKWPSPIPLRKALAALKT